MDSIHPAVVALHNPKHEMIEGLEFIAQPGWNKRQIDAKFRGAAFQFLLAIVAVAVHNEPERLTIIIQTAKS
jgi:hypothetical protein